MLYYVSIKIKIRVKEHFSEMIITVLDLFECVIKYEKCIKAEGYFSQKLLDIAPELWYDINISNLL